LNHSKTSAVSILSINPENPGSKGQASGGESSGGSSSGQTSGKEVEQMSSSSGSNSGGSGSSEDETKFFEALTPLACFVGGEFVGMRENEDEILGYMYANEKCIAEDISLDSLNFGNLKNAKVGIDVKFKKSSKKIRYENNVPCLDICIKISNASIKEIQNDEFIHSVSNEEFEFIKTKT
jgi:hypothetical protein